MIRPSNLLPRRTAWSIALISILAAAVLFLAALQYQWIRKLTEAKRERLQARLSTSVELFRDSFNRELTQLCNAFRRNLFPPATEDAHVNCLVCRRGAAQVTCLDLPRQ